VVNSQLIIIYNVKLNLYNIIRSNIWKLMMERHVTVGNEWYKTIV
jgi:hypothetical protein